MARWFDSAAHQVQFGKMCFEHTPITLVFEDDYRLECIPVMLTGDEYCVIIDQDDDGYGAKRGEKIYGDPEEITEVIIRDKLPEAQSA